jgi:hypothetical protein
MPLRCADGEAPRLVGKVLAAWTEPHAVLVLNYRLAGSYSPTKPCNWPLPKPRLALPISSY